MGGDCSKYVDLKTKRVDEIKLIKARYAKLLPNKTWVDPPLPVATAPKKGPGRLAAMRKKMSQSMNAVKATMASGPPPKGAITAKTAGRYYGNAQTKKEKIIHFKIPDARKYGEQSKIPGYRKKIKEYDNIIRRAKVVQNKGLPDPGPSAGNVQMTKVTKKRQVGGRRRKLRKTPVKRKRKTRKKPTKKRKRKTKRKTRKRTSSMSRTRKRRRRRKKEPSLLEWLGLA